MSLTRWAQLGIAAVTAGALFVGCSDEEGAVAPGDAGADTAADTGVDTGVVADSGAPETTADAAPTIPPGFDEATWTEVKKLSALPGVPADTTNKYGDNEKAAALGQMLFFDKSYSGALAVADDGINGGLGAIGDKGKVACASCHMGVTMDDDRSKPGNVSLGTDFGTRNALSIVNSSFYKWTNWGGRFDSQWSLALAVAENPKIMNSTRLEIAHMLWNKYRTEYDAIFDEKLDPALDPGATDASRFPASGKPKASATVADGAWELMAQTDRDKVMRIFVNYGKAIEAYERKVVSRNAPFDKFVAGDWTAIPADAQRGLRVFLGKGDCIKCHTGPNFADDKFHAIGVLQTGAKVPAVDLGRHQDVPPLLTSAVNVNSVWSDDRTTGKLDGLVQVDAMKGQFRTKSLRGVAASGPFMHSGQLATLEDVVAFYKRGGDTLPETSGATKSDLMKPIAFTGTDETDLVAFMKTLTGEPPPAALKMNTAK